MNKTLLPNKLRCIACNDILPVPIASRAGILCPSCKSQGLFRKRIIITGITRMNHGHICVSGIDPQTWLFIRPVFETGLERDFTMEGSSQIIRHFNEVEIEFKAYRPADKYHTEDWIINEKFAPRLVGHLSDEKILSLLSKMSITNLENAVKQLDKSLFIVKVKRIIDLRHEYNRSKFTVRISFEDYDNNIYSSIPVTDLLLLTKIRYESEHLKRDYKKEIISRFNRNPYRYIRVGLTREFRGQYWKQVTALITIPDMFNGDTYYKYEKKLGNLV